MDLLSASSADSSPSAIPFQLVILPGRTLAFPDLPQRSIALDGMVQGCHLDPTGYRFSFDHHEGIRFHQLSTCEQVCLAIEMGLDPSLIERVYLNDLDRDVAAALWLLANPQRAAEVRNRITALGRTDSHGPAAPGGATSPALQAWLPDRKIPLDEKAVLRALEGLSRWLEGRLQDASPATQDGEAILLPSLERVPAPMGAAGLYAAGHGAFVLLRQLVPLAWQYTVCKRSDFHPLDLEPLRHALLAREPGWGGTSTLLGSPRPQGSLLPPAYIIEAIREAWHGQGDH